jgi:hypothetical protein
LTLGIRTRPGNKRRGATGPADDGVAFFLAAGGAGLSLEP